ncbi:MAG: S46 family peptidase [Bacteroidetes bacterium]|nr:MAG: S46 family peptidase [Bacteroidota bacterium]
MVTRRLQKVIVIALVALVPALFIAARYAEGMFPLSELSSLDLKKAGLKIKTAEVYNPNGTSLVDALVRVGGCTGSFVSDDGLIITNHHCAFSSAAGASTPEKDYITNGFLAEDKSKEIRTPVTCRITASYLDVSAKVLEGTDKAADANQRAEIIRANIKKITTEEQTANPDMEIEISEMFIGKAYTLFRYQQIKDVRLVYIPQRCIGEFGGESDNWVWPRHNGDFAFFRAYVGADGKPAEYSATNIPYKPKKHLKVNPNGVKEDDFVFILGYPGRTFRHLPAKFLTYQYEYILPTVSNWYDYQIDAIKQVSKKNKAVEIALASREKSLANVTKNYKGKLQGLERTTVLPEKEAEEAEMKKMIAANPALTTKYGTLFSDIDAVYNEIFATYHRDFYLSELFNNSGVFYLSSFISYHNAASIDLAENDRKEYLEKTLPKQRELLDKNYIIRNKDLDKKLLEQLLVNLYELPESQRLLAVNNAFSPTGYAAEIHALVEKLDTEHKLFDRDEMLKLFETNPAAFVGINNKVVELAGILFPVYQTYLQKDTERRNKLTELNARMLEVKQQHKKTNFIPDANSTLRFTYGNVKGYWPNDAEYNAPFTTIQGILNKAKTSGDYYLESSLKNIMKKADAKAVVCFLYNLDTTGGNSGSPVLDAQGNLVGVNFDRAFTACINDYAWDEKYSRSIGVDIRYVLFVLKDIAKANNLIAEMGVKM